MSGRFRLILFAMAILFSSGDERSGGDHARRLACCDLPAIKALVLLTTRWAAASFTVVVKAR